MNESLGTKQRLIAAAKELFARQGYDNTSVREITHLAKANLGAVTYHFESKQNLYHQVLLSMAEPLFERLSAIPKGGGTPLDRIESFVRGYFDHMIENRELPALVMHEVSLNRPVPPPVRAAMERVFPMLIGIIKEGQQEGSIAPGDPALIALSVVVLPVNVAIQRQLLHDVFGMDLEESDVRAQVIDHIVVFIRRGLANPGRNK